MSLTTVEKNISEEVALWIERHLSSSPALTDLRKSALAEFKVLGLPHQKSEEYKYTPVARTLEKNFNFSLANAVSKSASIPYKIEGIDANIIVFINGVFSKEHSSIVSA